MLSSYKIMRFINIKYTLYVLLAFIFYLFVNSSFYVSNVKLHVQVEHGIDKVSLEQSNTVKQTVDNSAQDLGITYTNAKPFLEAKTDTDEVLRAEPMQFLTDVKNPCFALKENYINVGNITLGYALEKGYEIRCMPYVYQAGFTKSGTADIFYNLRAHKLFQGYCRASTYQRFQDNPKTTYCMLKEAHFWDNMYCYPNKTFDEYSKLYKVNNIAKSYIEFNRTHNLHPDDDYSKMVFADGTPRIVWHGDTWDEDISNQGLDAPEILLPHKIHRVTPNAKIIITMRNPTSRLFSDYKFYCSKNRSVEDFHDKVVDAIAWWRKCTKLYPVRTCAYGKAPPGLPELGFEICMKNKTDTFIKTKAPLFKGGTICQSRRAWALNAAERLRVGIYHIYIKDWFEVFPRENFLFLKFEDYVNDPISYIENKILPFLGLPQFSEETKEKLKRKLVANQTTSKMKMLPETKELLDKFHKETQNSLIELLGDNSFDWIA